MLRLQSPVDGSPIGEFPCADPDEVAAAIRAARAAQPAWAALDVRQRAAIVLRARDLVVERQDEIVATVMRETGKSLQDTLSMEIFASSTSELRQGGRQDAGADQGGPARNDGHDQEAHRDLPAHGGGRRDHALERALRARHQPHHPGTTGRQRGDPQGLGSHALGLAAGG
ncbi:MAG: aldehyde dehydrogenase family protein [Rhodocyclaceae bacterium]|nr:aldehyde dehydrogenase family protein [Rhodocyclaceae bacterium]